MDGLVKLELYPIGVIHVPEKEIEGTAFFPGGYGLYLEGCHRQRVEFPLGVP